MPAKRVRFRKEKQYPKMHSMHYGCGISLNGAGDGRNSIGFPIAHSDDGMGAPSSISTHPENSAFAVVGHSNCHVDSEVPFVDAMLSLKLSKTAIVTDGIQAVKVGYMVIAAAFKEPYEAADELTSTTTAAVLGLQKEATDRQAGFLYNGTDVRVLASGLEDTDDAQPFLTLDNDLEGVTFNLDTYYNALQYYSTSELIKKMQFGMKWITLTKNKPYVNIPIRIKRAAKFMNPYAFCGVLLHVPETDGLHQGLPDTDVSAGGTHLYAVFQSRFPEWNKDFDFERI